MDYQEQLKRMGKWEEHGEPEPEPEMIDWEQRRYEIAKDIMASLVLVEEQRFNAHINEEDFDEGRTNEGMAIDAVSAADALIEVLQLDKQVITKKIANGEAW